MTAIRPGVIIGAMALVLAVVGFYESQRSRGDAFDCVVEEVLPGSKGSTVFARCDGSLVKVSIPEVASLVHGAPVSGARLTVVQTSRGAVWNKPAARFALSTMLGAGFLFLSAIIWWRRTA